MPSFLSSSVFVSMSTAINPATGNEYIADTIGSVRNAFITCGFTRLTPQHNSGSLSSPDDLNALSAASTHNQRLAFDMFAFNDSWQATNPLYIKITYTTPGFWPGLSLIVEMGSQQNNSGSITSVDRIVTTAETVSNQGNLLPYTDRIQGSGDGSYISLLMFTNTSTRQYAGQVLLCERWYDRFGQPTGSGFHLVNTGLAVATRLTQQASKYGELALPASELYSVVNSRPSRAPAVYNGNLILGLIYPFYDTTLNPTPNLLLGESTTFSTPYSTVEYTVYGTRNTYVNAGAAVFDARQTVYSNGRWLVRYV